MNLHQQIRLAVRAMIADMVVVTNRTVEVTEVDEAKGFMQGKTDSGLEYFDILLSLDGDNGVTLLPTVGSRAVIGIIEGQATYAFLIMASKVDSINIKVQNKLAIRIDAGGVITINGDGNKGLVMIEPLVDKLNRLEDKVNGLIDKHNTHTHITTATVAATATPGVIAPTTAVEVPIAPKTLLKDLENTKVKHG